MPDDYKVLHYAGDVTGNERTQTGAILGFEDTTRRFYEVIDAEYQPCEMPFFPGMPLDDCPFCHGKGGRTTVHLQPATSENLRRAFEAAGL